jgi:uncharacterized membrane protein
MARHIRSNIKRHLGTLVGLALYFVAVTQFDISGVEDSQHPMAVWLVLAGAVVVYLVSYMATALIVAVYNRMTQPRGARHGHHKHHRR